MTRRFEVGPILVALGAIMLLVSLFMAWYGPLTAWDAFEVVDVLLAVLAVAALVVAAGLLLSDLEFIERRWLPLIVFAIGGGRHHARGGGVAGAGRGARDGGRGGAHVRQRLARGRGRGP